MNFNKLQYMRLILNKFQMGSLNVMLAQPCMINKTTGTVVLLIRWWNHVMNNLLRQLLSDQNISVINRRSCLCCCCRKIVYMFIFFTRTGRPIITKFGITLMESQTNMVQMFLEWRVFKFVQMKGYALFKGRYKQNIENT